MNLELVNIDLQKEKPKKFYQPIPPYNGFGSEEDSLGSVFSLQPNPPRKDLNKMFTVREIIYKEYSKWIEMKII